MVKESDDEVRLGLGGERERETVVVVVVVVVEVQREPLRNTSACVYVQGAYVCIARAEDYHTT